MIPPETQYARAPDGTPIAYQVTGGGDIDLVFMQGAVAHLDLQWEDARLTRLFERLSAFSRLIRFNRRGMGMSGVLERLPTLEEQVEDFGTVMDAVGSERAALFGTIDAGTFALAFAAAHPERTQAVVAFETAPRWTRSDTDDYGVEPEVLSRFAEATQAMDLDGQLSIVTPSRMEDPSFRSWFRRYTRSAQSGVPIQALMMMMMTFDIRDRLSAIDVPVLVLNRAEHAILPVRNGRALAEALRTLGWLNCRVATRRSSRVTSTRWPTRSRRSSQDPAHPPDTIACWRLCSSPTSWARLSAPPRSGTETGASWSSATTVSCARHWSGTPARKCTLPGTVSWRRSIRRAGPSSVPERPVRRSDRSASRSEPGFIRGRSNSRAETSRASPCTSAPASRRWLELVRSSSRPQ